jgi:hypothetical protein
MALFTDPEKDLCPSHPPAAEGLIPSVVYAGQQPSVEKEIEALMRLGVGSTPQKFQHFSSRQEEFSSAVAESRPRPQHVIDLDSDDSRPEGVPETQEVEDVEYNDERLAGERKVRMSRKV